MNDRQRKEWIAKEVKEAIMSRFPAQWKLDEDGKPTKLLSTIEVQDVAPLEVVVRVKTTVNGVHYYRVKISEQI